MRVFSSVVVGLGRIGQGYDYDCPDDAKILTHAAAFAHHPGFELMAGVDRDPGQRRRFEAKYRRPAYPDLASLWSAHEPEVYALAVPTPHHFSMCQAVIDRHPLAVLCEKPMAGSLAEGREMVTAATVQNCVLAVNYIRRCEPGVRALRAAITRGQFGEIFKGVVWYGKGIKNNGSHFIDLLHFLLGDVTDVRVLKNGRRWEGSDPEPDVCLLFGETPVYLLAGREECYSLAEMELFGTKARITYGDGGARIEVSPTRPDPVFPGYTILERNKETIPNHLHRYQWFVQDHLYRHLDAGEALWIDGRSALGALDVIEQICERVKEA